MSKWLFERGQQITNIYIFPDNPILFVTRIRQFCMKGRFRRKMQNTHLYKKQRCSIDDFSSNLQRCFFPF